VYNNVYETDHLYLATRSVMIDDCPCFEVGNSSALHSEKFSLFVDDHIETILSDKARIMIPLTLISLHGLELIRSESKGFILTNSKSNPSEKENVRYGEDFLETFSFRAGSSSAAAQWISYITQATASCSEGITHINREVTTTKNVSPWDHDIIADGSQNSDLPSHQTEKMRAPHILERPSVGVLSRIPGYRSSDTVDNKASKHRNSKSSVGSLASTSIALKVTNWRTGLRDRDTSGDMIHSNNSATEVKASKQMGKSLQAPTAAAPTTLVAQ
jgi:hypothetical protein